jgi:hypothetical protein
MDDVKVILLDAEKKPFAETVLKDVNPKVKYKLEAGKLVKIAEK